MTGYALLPTTPALIINLIVVALVTLGAFIFGGWREKAGVLVMCLSIGMSFILHALAMHSDSVWRYIIADEIYLIGMVALTWKSPHPWPLWVAALQLVAVGLDLNALFNSAVTRYVLFTTLYFVAYGQKIAFVIGIYAAWRRRRST